MIVTVEPCGACLPPPGFWSSTIPVERRGRSTSWFCDLHLEPRARERVARRTARPDWSRRDRRGLRALGDAERDRRARRRGRRSGSGRPPLSAGWSLSTSARLTAKPWFWSAALAWSKDRPTTDGTATRPGRCETLIRTLLPFTTVFPPGGSCPVTVSGGLLEATENTFATKPALVSVLTASACDLPTTLGHGNGRRPARDRQLDRLILLHLVPASGLWLNTNPFVASVLDSRCTSGTRPASRILLTASDSLSPSDERNGDGLVRVELVLDLRVGEPGGRTRRHEQQDREHPRPDRPAPSAAGLRTRSSRPAACGRVARAGPGPPAGRLVITDVGAAAIRPEPASTAVAASSVCGVDRQPLGDARQVGVHLLGALVALAPGPWPARAATSESRSCGTSGRSSDGGFGTSERCFIAISSGVSPVNGTCPVSIS